MYDSPTMTRKDFIRTAVPFFRPGLTDYFQSACAGHFRLSVSDAGVSVACYPGAAEKPARTFRL